MPGVPSSRGCDACRRQKKKCDQAQPSCSRCARLHIPCEGAGVQRFQFKYGIPVAKSRSPKKDTIIAVNETEFALTPIPLCPQNELTPLIDSFVDKIKPATNLSHNLAWTYGSFLEDVPKRLGINKALDAATETLLASYHCVTVVNVDTRADALVKYSKSLKALNNCLDDPTQAQSSETLCSVMLLLMSQGFLGGNGGSWTGHSEGAVQLLKMRGFAEPRDSFEAKLLLTLRGPIWEDLVCKKLDGSTMEGRLLLYLARAPDLMRRGGDIVAAGGDRYPIYQEAYQCYIGVRGILMTQQNRYETVEHKENEDPDSLTDATKPRSRLFAHYQRMYGLGLIIVLIFGSMVVATEDYESNTRAEILQYAKDAIKLAYQALPYRPLGSQYIVICLTSAWVGAGNDLETKLHAQKLMLEYSKDFPYWDTQLEFSNEALEQCYQRLRMGNG